MDGSVHSQPNSEAGGETDSLLYLRAPSFPLPS